LSADDLFELTTCLILFNWKFLRALYFREFGEFEKFAKMRQNKMHQNNSHDVP